MIVALCDIVKVRDLESSVVCFHFFVPPFDEMGLSLEKPCLGSTAFSMRKNRELVYLPAKYRPDREGAHRSTFEKNKKRILKTQDVCGICGKPVDKSLKYPHPMSAVIDHIIPVDKGGHPSDISNLQLAHNCCNRRKSDNLEQEKQASGDKVISNRVLPHIIDWYSYKA